MFATLSTYLAVAGLYELYSGYFALSLFQVVIKPLPDCDVLIEYTIEVQVNVSPDHVPLKVIEPLIYL